MANTHKLVGLRAVGSTAISDFMCFPFPFRELWTTNIHALPVHHPSAAICYCDGRAIGDAPKVPATSATEMMLQPTVNSRH